MRHEFQAVRLRRQKQLRRKPKRGLTNLSLPTVKCSISFKEHFSDYSDYDPLSLQVLSSTSPREDDQISIDRGSPSRVVSYKVNPFPAVPDQWSD